MIPFMCHCPFKRKFHLVPQKIDTHCLEDVSYLECDIFLCIETTCKSCDQFNLMKIKITKYANLTANDVAGEVMCNPWLQSTIEVKKTHM